MPDTIINIENITKDYVMGDEKETVITQALKGINLEIKQGDFIAIMGPSGSGKSTLMHILGFLDKPTNGKYYFEGKQTETLDEDSLADIRLNRVGFVFQAFNLLPRTSALDNVMLPLIYTSEKTNIMLDRAKKILQEVGLGDRLYHKPNELSGGQQQRVAIARALINDPAVIFADEPTGNLDTKSGEEIMNIFTKLNNDGHTIILVTHEHDIAAYCKRKIVLKDGVIIENSIIKK